MVLYLVTSKAHGTHLGVWPLALQTFAAGACAFGLYQQRGLSTLRAGARSPHLISGGRVCQAVAIGAYAPDVAIGVYALAEAVVTVAVTLLSNQTVAAPDSNGRLEWVPSLPVHLESASQSRL